MSFTKYDIPAKTFCIIDMGSYKLRLCAARFKNKQIELLSYSEKRQDISYFANNECLNLPGLCNNISEAIKKLERESGETLDNIIINYPFWELFLSGKKINHKRKFPHTEISHAEIDSIMQSVENLCLKKLAAEIDKLYGLSRDEIQIILSRVNSISIDGTKYDKILGKEGSNIKISLLNGFIPLAKHNLMIQMGNVLGKNIQKILPNEYCITKVFPEYDDVLIINLWATQTSLSLKSDGETAGISKVPIGINDLVSKIAKSHKTSKAQIIEKLDSDLYSEEKEQFLKIWGDALGITLKEMLWDDLCPKHFYICGGGAQNSFIHKYIQAFPFYSYDINTLWKIEYISEDKTSILKQVHNISMQDIEKIPLDMYALLLETNHMISKEKDIVSNSLKAAIKKLGYIKN